MTLIAPYLAAVVLLGAAGVAKLLRPNTTVGALRSIGLDVRPATVQIGSAAEVVIVVAALTTGGPVAPVLIAVSYAGLAGFVVLAWTKGGAVGSCGCFGEPDTPPTLLHALLNVGAAAVAAVVAAGRADRPLSALPIGLWRSATVLVLSALIAYLAYLAMAVLPKTRVGR